MAKLSVLFKALLNNLFASMPLSIFLMVLYAACIGWATFVEKEYGSIVAHDVIYASWWFELLNAWLGLSLFGCMLKSVKYNGFKVSVHTFHFALIVIIMGAGITRYYGFEGNMVLEDGGSSSFIESRDNFLNVLVSNDVGENGTQSDILPLDSFKKGYDISLSPYVRFSKFSLDTKEAFDKPLSIKSVSIINYSLSSLFEQAKNENREIDPKEIDAKKRENHYLAKFEVTYDGITHTMLLSNRGERAIARFGNRFITLSWGPKFIQLPFELKLDKFEVINYPGSQMPSSFASYVRVIDETHGEYPFKIFMNNVLDYKGYRFFQSEYRVKRDEEGKEMHDENGMPLYAATILSVNNDPGKIPTYIGYTLLILGALWLLFDNDSRFRKLSNYVKSQKVLSIAFLFCGLALFQLSTPLYANTESKNIESDTSKFSQELPRKKSLDSVNSEKKSHLDKQLREKYIQANEDFIAHIATSKESAEKIAPIFADMSDEAIRERIEGLKKIPNKTLKRFAKIQIQGFDGRIKLLDTYSDEIMRKVTGKKEFKGLKHNQFLLGLMTMPEDMAKLRLIKVTNKEILDILGVRDSYVSFEDLFHKDRLSDVYAFSVSPSAERLEKFEKAYKLYHFVNTALKKRDSERNEFDKQILRLHEKMDLLMPFSIWHYLRLIPADGDSWIPFGNPNMLDIAQIQQSNPEDRKELTLLVYFLEDFRLQTRVGVALGEWEELNETLLFYNRYQALVGGSLYLNPTLVESELFLNKTDVFPVSQYFYLALGMLLFFVAFIAILSNKQIPKWLGKTCYILLFCVFVAHTLGLILRWYVGGHAPWSNAYESMLYIAWASALSGVIILRKSYFAMCGASFLAGMALMVAHWGFMDPQIGNLQPVLQSYWLNIHVAVIVASYGFLGLSFMLGITNLILFIFRNQQKRPQVDSAILALSAISEMSMIIGILMLVVGTFLGGVWANESWGRYWGWDSKETWSLVSVGVYACVLHVRLLKPLYLPYIYNVLAVLAFSSILMTYFGVNFYLGTGMHAYAQGEGDSVNRLIFISLALIFILVSLAFMKRKLLHTKETH